MNRSKSGRILWGARRRAGLTQRQLAAAAGVAQPAISRIERGVVAPSLETLDRLVRACGMELDLVDRVGDGVDRSQIRVLLQRSFAERMRGGVVAGRSIGKLQGLARRT